MADSITQYRGDLGLGLGGSSNSAPLSDVRMFEEADKAASEAWKTINDTHKTIALMGFEFNQKMFAQKVKDRDTLYDMLDKGQTAIGNYRKEDKKYYDDAEKEYEKAFDEYYKKGINDADAMRKFKEASRKLKDVGVQLQVRYNHENTERTAISQEPITAKRDAREKALKESMSGDFWDAPKPYQQILDFVPGFNNQYVSMAGAVSRGTGVEQQQPSGAGSLPTSTTQKTTTTQVAGKQPKTTLTTTTAPQKPQKGAEPISGGIVTTPEGLTMEVSKGAYSWNRTKYNATSAYMDRNSQGYEFQSQLKKMVEQAVDPQMAKSHLDVLVQRAKDYNRDLGLNENDPEYNKYADAKNLYIQDANGRIKILANEPDFAALDAMAQVTGSYAPEQRTWLKDLDEYKLKVGELDLKKKELRDKMAIEWAKLGIDKDKANAQIKMWESKTQGSPEMKTKAIGFATNILSQLRGLANSDGVITPDKMRQLTSEQLKYLGSFGDYVDTPSGKVLKGVKSVDFGKDNYLIQLDGDKIMFMKNPEYNEKKGKWFGKFDPSLNTTVTNIATNRISEENLLSSGKEEISQYGGVDVGGASDPLGLGIFNK